MISSKDDSAGGTDCRYGHDRFPQFGLVVFFEPLPPVPSPAQPDPAATAAPVASTTPAPTGGGGSPSGSDIR